MSIEAINTARLQTPLPGNVIVGNPGAGGAPKAKPKAETNISNAFMEALNADLNAIHNVGLQFSVFEETGQTVVRVVDKDTGELVRQIPTKELLELAARLEDMMGILFDKQV